MVYVSLRTGDYGIGIVGQNLIASLERLTPVHVVGPDHIPASPLPGPLLERLDRRLSPLVAATRNVGYMVFTLDIAVRRAIHRVEGRFDVIAAACRWCESALRAAGLTNVVTIHQGVDGSRFNPGRAIGKRHGDEFIVFSGGKLELRKGQDVVIEAFRVLAQRHDDVKLVACWHNAWLNHAFSMRASPHTPFAPLPGQDFDAALRHWLRAAGAPLARIELMPPLANAAMAEVYGNSDIGLFPNRCEGGTNLVMMEYMACGRPVIATNFSGHCDVLTDRNSFRLNASKLNTIVRDGQPVACWCEPDVDETIEALEVAYQRRDSLRDVGRVAAADLAEWSWDRAARGFLALMN